MPRFAPAALLLSACGAVSVHDAIDRCEENCAIQAQGEACDREGVERECSELCQLISWEENDCADQYVAMYDCLDQEEFTCKNSFISINDVEFPRSVDPEACSEEKNTLSECQSGS